MDIAHTPIPGGLVLHLAGRLDSDSAPRLEPQVLAALPAGGVMVFDMARLRYCSSAGLRLLLVTIRQAQAQRTRLGLAAVPGTVAEVLESTGVDKLVPSFPSPEAAAKALG